MAIFNSYVKLPEGNLESTAIGFWRAHILKDTQVV